MSALPNDISTGIIRIGLRTVELLANVPSLDAVTGYVTFTPTPAFLRSESNGMIFPTEPITAYLDENGDADITLIATDATNISPTDWTYKVSFNLDNAEIASFHVDCPGGSDRELTAIAPIQESNGIFYAPGAVAPAGVWYEVSETPPASNTHEGLPVVWISGGSLLDPVPTTPQAPGWDLVNRTVTVASTTGVEYVLVDGFNEVPLATGTTDLSGYTRPYVAVVEPRALPGYVLTASYQWSRQFVDPASFTLYASDSLAGTAATLMHGRTWDMALGGSGTAPSWYRVHATANTMAITSDGASMSMDPARYADRWGGAGFTAGADDFRLEVDVTRYVPAHSRQLSISVGASGIYAGGGAKGGIYNTGGNTWQAVVLNGGPFTPSISFTYQQYLTSATEAQVLGTWKFTWVDKFLTMEAPDGTTWGTNYGVYTPSGWSWGQEAQITVSDYTGGTTELTWPWVGGVRLYR